VSVVLILLIAGWVIGSVSRIVGEVRRGWSMMVGTKAPPVTLDELNRRVQELGEQLTAYGA
jgi:hypothetical protein